jgi:hypothetical protein
MIKDFFSKKNWMMDATLLYSLIAAPVILFTAVLTFFITAIHSLNESEKEVIFVEKLFQKKKKREPFDKDPKEIIRNIEALNLLEEEQRLLLKIFQEGEKEELYDGVYERLAFLKNKNHIAFEPFEGNESVVWKVKEPIEMNQNDLKNILIIEKNFPYLFFSSVNFRTIDKNKGDIYTIEMEITQKGNNGNF